MAEPDRVKVLRVIARLNVGGPALHVAYLTAGLAERGFDTILVAGTLARGEASMESVIHVGDSLEVTDSDIDVIGMHVDLQGRFGFGASSATGAIQGDVLQVPVEPVLNS